MSKKKKYLRFIFSFVFQFVSVTFWVMFAYDREIVYPEIVDSYIPFWQNHGMHTTILVLILFEFFTTRHKFPPVSTSFVLYLGFVLCYAFVYVWLSIFFLNNIFMQPTYNKSYLITFYLICRFIETYFEKGRWVYPLFGMYNMFITLILIIVLFLKLIFCLFVGIFIQNVYWGKCNLSYSLAYY